jgi:hypothetical protein
MAKTFGAKDLMAALGLTATDWEIQSSNENAQKDHAVTKSRVGAYIAASEAAHNARTDITVELKSKVSAGATAAFTLGGAGTGTAPATVVVTAFSAKETYNDLGTLSLTAHRHDDGITGAVHLATPVAQAVSLSLGFGVLAVRLGGTLDDCQSAELSGSIEHKDRYSNQGNFLVGASTGLKYEATEEYVDDGSAVTVPSPWVEDSQDVKTANEDFYTRSVKAHAYSLA